MLNFKTKYSSTAKLLSVSFEYIKRAHKLQAYTHAHTITKIKSS